MDKYQKVKHITHLIPEFNGNPDELSRFISCVDRIHNLCTENEEQSLLTNHILFKLGHKVYEIIASVKPNSWEEIKTHLSKFYQTEDSFDDIERKISSLNFEPLFEGIQEYYLRTESLVSRYQKLLKSQCSIDDTKAKSIAEKRIVPRFIIGLPEPIRNFVRIHQTESLKKCMEIAVQELNFEKSMHEHSKYSNQFSTLQISSPQPPIAQVSQIKFCRYCKRNGHLIQECRTKQRNDSRVPQVNPNNSHYKQNNFSTWLPPQNSKPYPNHFNNVHQPQNLYSDSYNPQKYHPNTQYQHFEKPQAQPHSTKFLQRTQHPNDSFSQPQQSQSILWQNPTTFSTPIKNPHASNRPYNPNDNNMDNITSQFQGLNLCNRPTNGPDIQRAQIHHYESEEVCSENSNGLNNVPERNNV